MGIATLGKSLLSSSKKKAKKGQQLGLIAGAAMGIAETVNFNIKKKAKERAETWFNNSVVPVQKAATGFYNSMGKFVTKHDEIMKAGGDYGWEEGYVNRELKLLRATDKKLNSQTLTDDAILMTVARERAVPLIEKHRADLDFYKPYMDTTNKEFKEKLGVVTAKTKASISNDSLKKTIGRKYFGTDDGAMTAFKIKMSANETLNLDIPTEIYNSLDLTFISNILEGVNTRKLKAEEYKDIQQQAINLNILDEDEIKIIYKQVAIPKLPPKLTLDKGLQDAFKFLTNPGSVPKTNPDYLKIMSSLKNNTYIKDMKIMSKDGSVESTVSISDIQKDLEQTYKGIKITDPQQRETDWDLVTQAALQVASLELIKKQDKGILVTDAMKRQIASDAMHLILEGSITYKPTEKFKGLLKGKDYLLEPVQVDDEPKTLLEQFEEYQNSPEFKNASTEEQQQKIDNFNKRVAEIEAEKNNSTLEEDMQKSLSEDMTRVDGTEKSSTGFKGPITNNVDKSTMTEVSVGVMINGKETLVPAINELTTDAQIKVLQNLKIGVDPIPEDIQITAKKAAEARIEAGLNPFYQDEEEKNNTTTTTSTSLLNPSVPTQAELVKEFEILGASKMSSDEIDTRLNEMINQKEDFTTDEYIKLITYLNSKQGINPTSLNTSLLEPTKELTDSEIIANSLKGTGRNPLEVLRDSKINNLEKAVTRMKAGKPNIGTSSSAVVRWLKNTKDTDYYKLSTEERIASTEEYIETLKS